MLKAKVAFATFATTALICAGFAAPASSAPLVTGGLVNITITDVLTGDILSDNDVNLGVALNAAANVCGVNVNVLAQQLRNGDVSCSTAEQRAVIRQIID